MSLPLRLASEPSDEEDYCEPSPESNIRECGYEKWGFATYRTTYDGASARPWEEFKDGVLRNVRSSILKSDAPEILDAMDFVFVEDVTLESASVEELQRRFRAWVEREDMVPFEMSGGNDKVYVPRGARHEFFIKVDDVGLHASHVSLFRGFPEDLTEKGREHVKVWHHAARHRNRTL